MYTLVHALFSARVQLGHLREIIFRIRPFLVGTLCLLMCQTRFTDTQRHAYIHTRMISLSLVGEFNAALSSMSLWRFKNKNENWSLTRYFETRQALQPQDNQFPGH